MIPYPWGRTSTLGCSKIQEHKIHNHQPILPHQSGSRLQNGLNVIEINGKNRLHWKRFPTRRRTTRPKARDESYYALHLLLLLLRYATSVRRIPRIPKKRVVAAWFPGFWWQDKMKLRPVHGGPSLKTGSDEQTTDCTSSGARQSPLRPCNRDPSEFCVARC